MPDSQTDGGTAATLTQILMKQAEMGVTLAVISEQLRAVPDHEARIRVLEQAFWKLIGAAVASSAIVSAIGTWIGHAVR